jgi:methylmalonyl-CoA carboxyltransferase 12S subunit
VREVTAAAEENAKAINAALLFEIEDLIDPAKTRGLIAAALSARTDRGQAHRFVDTW